MHAHLYVCVYVYVHVYAYTDIHVQIFCGFYSILFYSILFCSAISYACTMYHTSVFIRVWTIQEYGLRIVLRVYTDTYIYIYRYLYVYVYVQVFAPGIVDSRVVRRPFCICLHVGIYCIYT